MLLSLRVRARAFVSTKNHFARNIVDPPCWRQYESDMLSIRNLDGARLTAARRTPSTGGRGGSTGSATRVARGWQASGFSNYRPAIESEYSLYSTTSLADPSGISTRGHCCCTPAQGRRCLPAAHRPARQPPSPVRPGPPYRGPQQRSSTCPDSQTK